MIVVLVLKLPAQTVQMLRLRGHQWTYWFTAEELAIATVVDLAIGWIDARIMVIHDGNWAWLRSHYAGKILNESPRSSSRHNTCANHESKLQRSQRVQ